MVKENKYKPKAIAWGFNKGHPVTKRDLATRPSKTKGVRNFFFIFIIIFFLFFFVFVFLLCGGVGKEVCVEKVVGVGHLFFFFKCVGII